MLHPSTETIIDYAHGALEASEDAQTFVHVSECGDCQGIYQEELAIAELLRSRAQAEEREFPASLQQQIRQAVLVQTHVSPVERLRAVFRPALLGVAAIAGAILIVPHFAVIGPAVPQSVNVAAFFSRHDAAAADLPLTEHTSVADIETAAFVDADASDPNASAAN